MFDELYKSANVSEEEYEKNFREFVEMYNQQRKVPMCSKVFDYFMKRTFKLAYGKQRPEFEKEMGDFIFMEERFSEGCQLLNMTTEACFHENFYQIYPILEECEDPPTETQ